MTMYGPTELQAAALRVIAGARRELADLEARAHLGERNRYRRAELKAMLIALAAEYGTSDQPPLSREAQRASATLEAKRDTLPPVLAANTPVREQSNQHFREARRILRGVKR